MKPHHLFIFSISVFTCFSLLLFGALYDNSAWATVGISGILVIITAYYALSTDKILTVNQKQLELLTVQQRSPKIEEIFKTVFIPLYKRIKIIDGRIKDKSDVSTIDLTQNRIDIHALNFNYQYSTELEFIKSQLRNIKVYENYEEPIFQQHIKLIFECVREYDIGQKDYQDFLKSTIPPLFQNLIFPFTEKIISAKNPTSHYNVILFILLVKGDLDFEMQRELKLVDSPPRFSKEYSDFIDDCYQNNLEFQKFIQRKSEHEEKLIKKLELLSTELNLLLSEWMNVYHLTTQSD